jgi:hypothetical protein
MKTFLNPESEIIKFGAGKLVFALVLLAMAVGCRTPDPATHFMARMERSPVEQRPKDWEQTKRLMARLAPEVGQPAPDFSLPTLDGAETVVRSAYQARRPLVLIFGSFT